MFESLPLMIPGVMFETEPISCELAREKELYTGNNSKLREN